jgi:hypothetical protein
LAPFDVAASSVEQVATEATPRPTVHIVDRPHAEYDFHPGKAFLQDPEMFHVRSTSTGSFLFNVLAFRPGKSTSEETTEVLAKQEDNAREGSTDHLKCKKP